MMMAGWAALFNMNPDHLPIVAACAVLGAVFLARFTNLPLGFNYVSNLLVLIAGAMIANWLLGGIVVSIGYGLQKTLLISFAGMAAASLLSLLLWGRNSAT